MGPPVLYASRLKPTRTQSTLGAHCAHSSSSHFRSCCNASRPSISRATQATLRAAVSSLMAARTRATARGTIDVSATGLAGFAAATAAQAAAVVAAAASFSVSAPVPNPHRHH